MINSSEPPHDKIVLEVWDYITHEEYENSINKVKNKTAYYDRFAAVRSQVKDTVHVKLIEYLEVNNLQQALHQCSKWMQAGFEGGVLKDFSMVFKNGTSNQQLKLKLEIDCEMRIKAFQDGSVGTKREGKVGSVIFENDEGTIKGKCSGFSDKILDDMTENPGEYLEKVFTCQFNDLSKPEGHDYYSLMHPRWVEVRNDKTETDTLETVMKYRQMAMELS